LAEIKDRLGDALGRDVFFVSLTVDPENDTPEALKAFAEAFGASAPGWRFITGTPVDMAAITAKFGDRSDRKLSDHRNELLIGNDRTGDWERASPFQDIDQLVMTVYALDAHEQTPPPQATAGRYVISNQPGEAMFKKLCAPCHTIGGGDHVGPDLRGVVERRDPAWLTDFIRNPTRMVLRHDPDALALVAKYPVRMPFMGLTANDAYDMISYLMAQSSK
jgi:protein SCO1/2